MFGDIFGNLEEKQKQLKKQLADIPVTVEIEGGALKIEGSADKQIKNIHIDQKHIIENGTEALEDLLIVGFNQFIEKSSAEEAAIMKDTLSNMMPGLGGMFS